ncbi:MAG: DUF2892 domain-containing protein, partial [Pseudomonadota bacterium]
MIKRNLGNLERAVRLLLGVFLLAWAWQQQNMTLLGWCVVIAAVALVLNGIFSRCYLWYVLDLDSCKDGEDCIDRSSS